MKKKKATKFLKAQLKVIFHQDEKLMSLNELNGHLPLYCNVTVSKRRKKSHLKKINK